LELTLVCLIVTSVTAAAVLLPRFDITQSPALDKVQQKEQQKEPVLAAAK
jgi:hypothetical protein